MTSPASTSSGKLYEVVASVIRHRLREGSWPPDGQLPKLDALAAEFGVSNITVRQALRDLEQEGLIVRRQGVGTFVAPSTGRSDLLLRLETRWGAIIHATDPIDVEPLESRPETGLGSLPFSEATRAPAYRYIKRLHSMGGKPFAVVEVMLDEAMYERAPEAFETRRVIHVLDGFRDVRICDARQYLSIGVADIEVAQRLGIALGAPVGKLRRVLVDQRGIAVLVANVVYPGDLVRLEMSLPPDGASSDRT